MFGVARPYSCHTRSPVVVSASPSLPCQASLQASRARPARHPELYIVATPCVTANHGALVELTCGRPVLMAFDQDFYSNETVCFHLAALIAKRLRRERTLVTTRIASWDARVKGIDDAAVRNLPITSISVQRWLDRLRPRFRQIAMTRLSEIAGFPSEQSSEGRQKPPPTLFR
jgi:hypothetical protein